MRPFESESRVAVNRSLRLIVSLHVSTEIRDILEGKLKLENYRGERTKRMFPKARPYHTRPALIIPSMLRPKKSPTNILMEQRVHEQNLMYIRFAERGFIPPPWKAYGRRHREEIDALRAM